MYTIAICDDDDLFCYQLEDYITQYCSEKNIPVQTEVFNTCETFKDCFSKGMRVDLLFLDIGFTSELSKGIELGNFIRSHPENETTQIVYISLKSQYALQLFRIKPLDFLIKPITPELVAETMDIFVRLFVDTNVHFHFLKNEKEHHIEVRNIFCLQSIGKRIHLFTTQGEYIYYGKLSDALKQLPENLFITVHKSFIVNMNYIIQRRTKEVILSNQMVVPVSHSKSSNLRDYMSRRR